MIALNYQIHGSVMPMIEFQLDTGEHIWAQTGAMRWMNSGIDMKTKARGGLFGMIKRSVSGGDIFVAEFIAAANNSKIAFGHTYPGKIITFNPAEGPIVCQQRSFLCATAGVNYKVYFQRRMGAGFFGGEGFILQKFTGHGLVAIEMDGEYVQMDLQPGETIRVETGSVGAFDETVSMNVEFVKGFTNMFLGGEGMFLTTLKGPGRAFIQTMPVQNMAGEIFKYLPSKKK